MATRSIIAYHDEKQGGYCATYCNYDGFAILFYLKNFFMNSKQAWNLASRKAFRDFSCFCPLYNADGMNDFIYDDTKISTILSEELSDWARSFTCDYLFIFHRRHWHIFYLSNILNETGQYTYQKIRKDSAYYKKLWEEGKEYFAKTHEHYHYDEYAEG